MPLNRTKFIAAIVVALAAGVIIGSVGSSYVNHGAAGSDVSAAPPAGPVAPAWPAASLPPRSSGQMNGKASLTMQEAADRLALRLTTEGGNADDWALLARSFVELRQYPEAVHAFDEALKKSPNDAQLRQDADLARKAAAGVSTVR